MASSASEQAVRGSSPTCPHADCWRGPCRTAARFILAEPQEVPPDCPNRVALPATVAEIQRRLGVCEPFLTPAARGLLGRLPRAGTIENRAKAVLAGTLVLLETRVVHPIGGGAVAAPEAPPEPVIPPPGLREQKAWIKFRIVDDRTGAPVPNVVLALKLPNGNRHPYTSRPDGMIEIDDLDPGTCDIEKMIDADALEVVRVE